MDSTVLWALIAGLYGLLFGSFANVIIWRYPRGESLVTPGSHCPSCASPIAWYDNIPVVSWVALRGRCRSCREPISVRYPIVELLSGLLWAIGVLAFGPSVRAAFAIVFYYLLLLLAAIDLDVQRLPNLLVALLGLIGMTGVVMSTSSQSPAVPLIDLGVPAWQSSLVGAASAAGTALGIALLYRVLRNVDGFGMGDVKLLAVIGLYLGPHGVMTLFIASLMGAAYGVYVARTNKEGMKARIPFGPFLSASAVFVSLGGPQVWSAYMRLVSG